MLTDQVFKLFSIIFHVLKKIKITGKNKILVRVSVLLLILTPDCLKYFFFFHVDCSTPILTNLKKLHIEGAYPVFGLLFKCVSNAPVTT